MYDYGRCHKCGGEIHKVLTTQPYRIKSEIVAVIERVPTGVCSNCGETVFSIEVGKAVEAIALKKLRLKGVRYVPVVSFAKQQSIPQR